MRGIIGGMKELVRFADVITPNLTEACLLLSEDYINRPLSDKELCNLLHRLSELGADKVAITSVMTDINEMSVGAYDKAENKYYKIDCGYVDRPFHGTGDIFASVLTGALLNGESFVDAANTAVGFIRRAISTTQSLGEDKTEHGVIFEPVLASYFSGTKSEKLYKIINE